MPLNPQPKLFKYRHFEPQIILLCLRWYLRYSLSYRDLEELMAERGLSVDHTTIYRWVQHYSPHAEEALLGQGDAEPSSSQRTTPGEWTKRTSPRGTRSKGSGCTSIERLNSTGATVEFMLSLA